MSGTNVLPVVCTLLALSSWIGRTVSGQADFYPFGLPEGDVSVPEADDESSPEIHLQQSFTFFGDHYTQLYVSTNGVVSFEDDYSFCCNSLRSIPISPAPPLLSPFWHDIDIRRSGDIFYRQTSAPELLARAASEIMLLESGAAFTPTLLFIVTYDRVAAFRNSIEGTSSFQAVLATDGEGSSAAIFLYGDIGWGDSATVGFNAGDGVRYFEVAGSETNQTLTFNLRSNVGIPGTYVFSTDFQGMQGSTAATSAAATSAAATSAATTSAATTSTAATSAATTSTAATEPTEAMDATETRAAASQSLPIIILAVVLGVVVVLSVLIIVALIVVILKQRSHQPVSHTPVLHNNQPQRKEEQCQAPINSYESRELHHTSVQSPIGVGPCVAYAKTEHSDQLHEEYHMYDVVRNAGEHAQYPRAIYEVPEDQK